MIITELSILRQKSRITNVEEVKKLNLVERLRAEVSLDKAAGIAAIQIGEPYRVALVRCETHEHKHEFLAMMNPIMTDLDLYQRVHDEGCLSLPGQKFDTMRYFQVTCNWEDPVTGKSFAGAFSGQESVAVQHEIDHMLGVLVCDKAIPVFQRVGRNDLCPCNSGLKYKKCHGR